MKQTFKLSSTQSFLYRQIKYWVNKEENAYKVTVDDGKYYSFNNGKRFYSFNFYKENKTFFGIREDGNTRCVFNGTIENFDDFKKIDNLTQ